MDPLSILGASSAAASLVEILVKLSSNLYTFVKETQHVNRSVNDLITEVNSLNFVVKSIKDSLGGEITEHRVDKDDNRVLWDSIRACLDDCQRTVIRLDASIEVVRPEGKNFAQQAIRRIRLNLKEPEITGARTMLSRHSNTLQLALQTVTLRATYLTPGAVADQLRPMIDELRDLMQSPGLDANMLPSAPAYSLGAQTDESVPSYDFQSTSQKQSAVPAYMAGLQASAQKVISSARTVSARSEAATSVFGDGMDADKIHHTMSWIPEPMAHEDLEVPSRGPSPSVTTAVTHETFSNPPDPESSDTDDEQFEMVEQTFKRGIRKFNEANYPDAQPILERGLELTAGLPLKLRQKAQVAGVKLMIATCIYHGDDPSAAEHLLTRITQEKIHENATKEGSIRRCQASHLLASLLYRQRRYQESYDYCFKSRNGRRRVLGKTDDTYYESTALLSQICMALGQKVDSETYWEQIPEDLILKLPIYTDEDMIPEESFIGRLNSPRSPSLSGTKSLGEATRTGPLPVGDKLPPRALSDSGRSITSGSLMYQNSIPSPPIASRNDPLQQTGESPQDAKKGGAKKKSLFGRIKRRMQPSSTVPNISTSDDKNDAEEAISTTSSRTMSPPSRPTPQQRRSTGNSSSTGRKKQTFLEYKLEEDGDESPWGFPGLNT